MNNFEYWKEEIADMPGQDENGWYDLETGLRFDSTAHYRTGGKTTRWEPSSSVKEYRKIAKFYGGKALTGSAKQKEWAESIRAKFLESDVMSDEDKAELIALGGPVQSSKFWILNKDNLPKLTKANVLNADKKIRGLIDQHYDTLARSGAIEPKEEAKLEIYNEMKDAVVKVGFSYNNSIPNFDPFDVFGELLPMSMQGGRLTEEKKSRKWGRR